MTTERRALLFDLDGTLSDPREGIERSLRFALEKLGQPAAPGAALGDCIGPPLREVLARLLGGAPAARVEQAVALYRERYGALGQTENRLYPGIAECLAALIGRARLFVCSAKPTGFVREIVAHFGLRRHFAGLYGSEPDGTRSDKAALIAHLLQREGIAASAATMIGDRASDVRGALRNGVAACGVTWGYGSVQELSGAGARTLFRHPGEIARHFARPAADPRAAPGNTEGGRARQP